MNWHELQLLYVPGTLHSQEQNAKSSAHAKDGALSLQEDLLNTHVGIGCDMCGVSSIDPSIGSTKDSQVFLNDLKLFFTLGTKFNVGKI